MHARFEINAAAVLFSCTLALLAGLVPSGASSTHLVFAVGGLLAGAAFANLIGVAVGVSGGSEQGEASGPGSGRRRVLSPR
jgi:hypothetical protein